ncbi:zinc finger protein 346-like isoform X2 [Centruroides sculpturatus]|uniref:zinc finger protein 346-like isoform X2 n=1 Tax=Centruroides sculpturatus TaxID=218467 RepID=UPI000C6E9237|nr:zinc finger protein 346-like isoform X2 [Centruroides sculpturatus]
MYQQQVRPSSQSGQSANNSFSNDNQFQQNSFKNEMSRGLPPGFSKAEAEQKNSRNTEEDPVTKAMVNNLMGNVPNKKNRVTLHCDLCNLEFSSQIPLDMHLKGAKHAKKLRSMEILNVLEQDGKVVQPKGVSNSLRCEICDVIGNSSQQLQMHLTGNKHKSKCRSLGIDPSCFQKPPPPPPQPVQNVEEEKSLKRTYGNFVFVF